MNKELVKKIALQVHLTNALPTIITGYNKDDINGIVNEMIEMKVIYQSNFKSKAVSADPNIKTEWESKQGYVIDTLKLQMVYGIDSILHN